jgi:GNAT superfamily N-acetyltransferase
MDRLTIRAAGADEAARLTEIAFAAKRHWGYPERWITGWRATLTPAFVAAHPVFAAEGAAGLLGVYALCLDAQTADLEHFWVHPAAMGRGVGRALFGHARAEARRRGARRLRIESDPFAEGFYLRMGARREGAVTYPFDGGVRILPVLVLDL